MQWKTASAACLCRIDGGLLCVGMYAAARGTTGKGLSDFWALSMLTSGLTSAIVDCSTRMHSWVDSLSVRDEFPKTDVEPQTIFSALAPCIWF